MRNRLTLALYFTLLTALTVWFIWPIYQDTYMFVSVGLGLAVGFGISWIQAARKLSLLSSALTTLTAFILLALPATNPRAMTNQSLLLSGWIESLTSPVNAWKQLVTVELPVGTYHALLAPAFLSYLIAGVVFGWVFFGPITRFWAVSYPMVALVVMGISFGNASVPGDFQLFGIGLPVSTPMVSGSLLFALMVVYLNWGSKAARRATLTNRVDPKTSVLSGWQRKLPRTLAAVAVVAIALAGTGFYMNATGVSSTRIVLRTDIALREKIADQTSPLATYRKYFEDPQVLASTILTYTAKGAPDRIRIATMPFYDGDNFTVAPTKGGVSSENFAFARVPSALPPTSDGPENKVTITVGKLDSIWLPLVSGVRQVDFTGTRSLKLADSLFVNRETATGAVVPDNDQDAKLLPNTNDSSYTVTYNQVKQPEPTSIEPKSSNIDQALIPESLTTWLDKHSDIDTSTAAGIQQLAAILRDRGYLSHSFVAPGKSETASWMDNLDNYSFFQSNAGHNMARISAMFDEINSREQDAKSRNSKNLVSTAGDDEQFATAIALIASAKGFKARVVVGFRTSSAIEVPGVNACSVTNNIGTCTGANVAAWAEIRGNNDQWLAIDATPQFAKKMNLMPIGTAYVPNPTKSGEDHASVLPPAKATPSSDSLCRKNPNSPECNPDDFWQKFFGFFMNYVVPVLVTTLVVGIFAAPFAFVVLTKRNRRRTRKQAAEPEVQVIGAWEEYIDLLVDHGSPLPGSQTRKELAVFYQTENIDELAQLADLAAFSPRMPNDDEIARAWEIFEEQNKQMTANSKRLQRIKASLSLRSFLRNVSPKQEFLKLRNRLNFTQVNRISEGSAIEGLTIEFRRQWRSMFKKKSK